MKVHCPYCEQPAKLVAGSQVYPHRPDLWKKKFYVCYPCDARVGCHDGTTQPFGPLANARLRELRFQAHSVFDPLWREHKLRRNSAYAWLAEVMGVHSSKAHIGMFDENQCEKLIAICTRKPNPLLVWVREQGEYTPPKQKPAWVGKIKEHLFP